MADNTSLSFNWHNNYIQFINYAYFLSYLYQSTLASKSLLLMYSLVAFITILYRGISNIDNFIIHLYFNFYGYIKIISRKLSYLTQCGGLRA